VPIDTEHLGGQVPDLVGQRTLTDARADHAAALDLGEQLRRPILGIEEIIGSEILIHACRCYDRDGALMSLVVPPYPPPRYTDAEPEISAWVRRGTAPPDYDSFGLVQYHYLANQTQTGGDYGLYRVDIAPNGGGPGPHFHRAMSEAFFVLSGTVKLYDGTGWADGTQNDFLYVPPGGIHGFRNESDEPTSLLMLFAPGAPREHYFEGFAQLADLTDDERREWFIKNDNFFID
jgi:mannose-6-phosphate isomerase-like protein (cupin superfamily)